MSRGVTNNIWKNAFKSGGEVENTEVKNGMQSKLHLSPINTSGRATISYAFSRAIIELGLGMCSIGKEKNGGIYVEIIDSPTGTIKNVLLYNSKTQILEGYRVGATLNTALAFYSPGHIHWSVFIPRIVQLLIEVDAFRENFNLIREDLKNFGKLNKDRAKEMFILNDFLYESRTFYIQKNEQIQYATIAPAIVEDLTPIYCGRAGNFEYAKHEDIKEEKKSRFGSPTIKPEDLTKYKLSSNYNYPPELIPSYDLTTMKINRDVLCLAEMVEEEINSGNPVNNILLYGEAGAGKSTVAKILAQLWDIPYRFTNFSLNSEESELIGTYRPKADGTFDFFEPAFVKTFRDGGVIELMEINYARPGALGVLNSALDDTAEITIGNGENVKRHPQCIIIATTNVAYAGCQQMNAALKDRFHELLEIQKMSAKDLIDITMRLSGNTDALLIGKMVDAVQKITIKMNEEQITGGVCSTRQLINWARKMRYRNNPIEAAKTTVLAGVSFEKEIVNDVIDTILKPLF